MGNAKPQVAFIGAIGKEMRKLPKIHLNINKSEFSQKFFPYLEDWSTRWFVLMGGAGSGKSYFITQKIIIRCVKEPVRFAVCRRYGSTLRNSCFALFKEVLEKWKLLPYVKIKETDMSITFPNGSTIIMLGLDEETKLLSLANISGIWVEEAFEVEKSKIEQLNLRMRGQASNQQIILSFNPISQSSYLYDMCEVNPPQSFTYIISTYKDNPFLNAEYVQALDEMAIRNPAKYKVYGLAQYGVNVEDLVITNWEIQDFDPLELASKGLEHRSGMDVGWTDPTAVVDTLYDKENRTIYVFNEFYKTGCQQSEILTALQNMKLTKNKLYVDSAEPQLISFLRSSGINAFGSIKGRDSVKAGTMFLQDNKIIVRKSCQNVIMELNNFIYIRDKNGTLTEDTDHQYSHSIDALRYAYCDIYTNKKLKSLNKSALGL